MDNALYYKLAKFLIMCTPEELDYIASFDYEGTTQLTAMFHHCINMACLNSKKSG